MTCCSKVGVSFVTFVLVSLSLRAAVFDSINYGDTRDAPSYSIIPEHCDMEMGPLGNPINPETCIQISNEVTVGESEELMAFFWAPEDVSRQSLDEYSWISSDGNIFSEARLLSPVALCTPAQFEGLQAPSVDPAPVIPSNSTWRPFCFSVEAPRVDQDTKLDFKFRVSLKPRSINPSPELSVEPPEDSEIPSPTGSITTIVKVQPVFLLNQGTVIGNSAGGASSTELKSARISSRGQGFSAGGSCAAIQANREATGVLVFAFFFLLSLVRVVSRLKRALFKLNFL
jgi:hypothetical protein